MKGRTTYRWGMPLGVFAFSAVVVGALVPAAPGAGVNTALATALVVTVALGPLYGLEPKRTIDVLRTTVKRVTVACLALVAIGVIGPAYVPSPGMVAVLGVILVPMVPLWRWTLSRRSDTSRVLVVGDDPSLILETIRALPTRPVGFLSPRLPMRSHDADEPTRMRAIVNDAADGRGVAEAVEAMEGTEATVTDGGDETRSVTSLDGVERLSGLSRLEHVIGERAIDTVSLAFAGADRGECFGTLRVCRDNGVSALVRPELEESVLVRGRVGDLMAVDLDPWPWYSRVVKRSFDVAFAATALIALTPLILVISVAIKLDSSGPVLYGQPRTAELGATFQVWKFRSMVDDTGNSGPTNDAERITRVGRVLRRTHLDEIPQLVSILTGDMSVVGPRAVWTDEEDTLLREVRGWPKRWAVTPGLTGLAQIRGGDTIDGTTKLAHDLQYIRRQSILLDLRIVFTQLSMVVTDVLELMRARLGRGA